MRPWKATEEHTVRCDMHNRAFTAKSAAFGLIGLLVVCVFPAYSASVLKLSTAIRGSYLPVVPLFLTVVLSFGWNALAGRFSQRLAFSAGELAVVFCLMAVVSWLPSLQHPMVRQMVLPRYEELTTNASWKEAGVTTRMPARLFPCGQNGAEIGENTHLGMIQGGMPVKSIPFGAWVGPLLNWTPFLFLLVVSSLALTFLVHRQWTRHEQLRYPIASVIDLLIKQAGHKPGGVIFRNRMFRIGFGLVFGMNVLRYLHAWFPGNLPTIPTEYVLDWNRLFPVIGDSNASMFGIHWMPISFALIGIAYFVATDVSLSVGLTAPLATILGVQYYLVTGSQVASGDLTMFRAGGFIAIGIILLYTGRTYYFPLFRKAVWPGGRDGQADPGGVWAARIFLAAYVAVILVTAGMGVGFMMAWVIVTFLLLVFLVVTRLVCETGVPTIVTGWSLPTVLSGLMGPAAIGAGPLMFMMFLNSTMMGASTSTLMMPYMATGLKVLDDNHVNLRRFAVVSTMAIIVAMVIGFGAVIMLAYTQGEGTLLRGERAEWTQGVRQVLSMMDIGQYEASEAANGFSKLALIRPDGKALKLVLTGIVAVVGCCLLRFRFTRWPLHPLFFIVLGTSVGIRAWTSFMLGWVIKTLIVKIGGGRAYQGAKPLFVGFIIGEFMIIAVTLIVGLIYNAVTGGEPASFWMI